jgi:hypothetical protein
MKVEFEHILIAGVLVALYNIVKNKPLSSGSGNSGNSNVKDSSSGAYTGGGSGIPVPSSFTLQNVNGIGCACGSSAIGSPEFRKYNK